MNRLIISIEGCIGAGKTTLIHKLESFYHANNIPCIVIIEPIDKWFHPYNLIEEVEKNTELKPIVQLFIFHTLANRLNNLNNVNGIVIIERSVGCAMAQFCSDIADPKIKSMMHQISSIDNLIDFYIVININDESNKNNILQRNRQSEFNIMNLEEKINYNHQLNKNLNRYLTTINPDKIISFDFDNYNNSFNDVTNIINNKLKFTYIQIIINYVKKFFFFIFK